QACFTHCSEGGFQFMGLQFGYECYCGSSSDARRDTKFGPGVCDFSCMGDENSLCGECLTRSNTSHPKTSHTKQRRVLFFFTVGCRLRSKRERTL
ncbi:unnamed protein product, partial [Hapterophycus canaliculatus]